ncbi:hypothetical protein ACU686_23270 [Yinghuangia aomiensis]
MLQHQAGEDKPAAERQRGDRRRPARPGAGDGDVPGARGRRAVLLTAAPVGVQADVDAMTRALGHLLADTVGAVEKGATVVVAAEERDGKARIEVRGPASRGSSVHVPLARTVVEAHGGTVEHTTEDDQSVYVVELPADKDAAEKARPQEGPDGNAHVRARKRARTTPAVRPGTAAAPPNDTAKAKTEKPDEKTDDKPDDKPEGSAAEADEAATGPKDAAGQDAKSETADAPGDAEAAPAAGASGGGAEVAVRTPGTPAPGPPGSPPRLPPSRRCRRCPFPPSRSRCRPANRRPRAASRPYRWCPPRADAAAGAPSRPPAPHTEADNAENTADNAGQAARPPAPHGPFALEGPRPQGPLPLPAAESTPGAAPDHSGGHALPPVPGAPAPYAPDGYGPQPQSGPHPVPQQGPQSAPRPPDTPATRSRPALPARPARRRSGVRAQSPAATRPVRRTPARPPSTPRLSRTTAPIRTPPAATCPDPAPSARGRTAAHAAGPARRSAVPAAATPRVRGGRTALPAGPQYGGPRCPVRSRPRQRRLPLAAEAPRAEGPPSAAARPR